MDGLPDFLKQAVLQHVGAGAVVAPPEERLPGVRVADTSSLARGFRVVDGRLGEAATRRLSAHLQSLRPRMRPAGMQGGGHKKKTEKVTGQKRQDVPTEQRKDMPAEEMLGEDKRRVDSAMRGDVHMWLDAAAMQSPEMAALAALFDEHRRELQRLSPEFNLLEGALQTQATCYPGGGAQYVRHLDASRGKAPTRVWTLIWYPQASQGGQLRLFLENGDIFDVEPQPDRLVIFQSRLLEHAVLPCQSERYAVSQWICEKQPD